MDESGTWHGGRPQPWRLSVRWGPSTPPAKGGGAPSPIFGPFLLWPNGWMHEDATWYGHSLSAGDFVLDGEPVIPPRQGGGAPPPKFSAHVYCGHTAGWIKMSLGMEVGLGLCDATLCSMWTQLPPEKKGTPTPTLFLAHVYCGQMAGWMKTQLGTEVGLGAGHIVLDGVTAPAKGAQHPPLFRPCLLWPQSPISATAELLLYFYSGCFWSALTD